MSEFQEDKERYLVYRIDNELYASPLLDFKEVIEYIKPKIVPNMPEYFSGMINLRGLIIGVIDVRKKIGISSEFHQNPSLLICETDSGPMGAIIDKVESVIHISPKEVQDLKVEGKIDLAFLKGFYQHQDKFISIIDIKKFVSKIEKNNQNSQEKAA
jgi:purine-binding chemotaxis protein CheW